MIRRTLLLLTLLILLFVIAVQFRTPSHERDWNEYVSRLPHITEENGVYTVHNLRDWTYTKEGPSEKVWREATYKPAHITRVWFVEVPFSGWDGIAHTMLTFDFRDAEPLTISIEARRENGEDFSTIQGLFNEYELLYVWSTEHDALTRRAVHENDALYMYPLAVSDTYAQALFTVLVERTNAIYEEPQFYNTLASNCTNLLADAANAATTTPLPWHISRLLPGYADAYLHKQGLFDTQLNFPTAKITYRVDAHVATLANTEQFSEAIRALLTE
jgi:hypothetical protein